MFLTFVCVVSLHHLFSRFVTFRAHSTTSHRRFNSEFPKNSLKQSSTATIFTIHQIGMSSRANIIFSLHLLPSSIVRPFHFFLPDFHNACRLLLLLSFALSNNTYHNICYHFSFSHSLSSRGACRSAFRISNTCWVDQETCRMTEIGKKNHWNTFFFLAGEWFGEVFYPWPRGCYCSRTMPVIDRHEWAGFESFSTELMRKNAHLLSFGGIIESIDANTTTSRPRLNIWQ